MAGPNQHHIPQFFQRGFGVKPKGKAPKEIWVFRPGAEPELARISKTASEDFFYGPPAADGVSELDQSFTLAENRIAEACRRLRVQAVGSSVDAATAADIVIHLAPRSSHMRSSFGWAIAQLMTDLKEVISEPDQLEQLLGLNKDQPSERFREKLRESLGDEPRLEAAGLPQPVLERAAFYIAKESFAVTMEEAVPRYAGLLNFFVQESPLVARDSHNRALGNLAERPGPRYELLASFEWTVEAAPDQGAILPDCIAIAYSEKTAPAPLLFVGKDVQTVAMPLAKDRLLVGRTPGAPPVKLANFNKDAAASSQEFFLADSQTNFAALASLIGSRSRTFFEEATRDAFRAILPPATERPADEDENAVLSAFAPSEADLTADWQLSFHGVASEEVAHQIASPVNALIRSYARHVPLSRLDGITFAADYPTELREVDRGREDLPPIETTTSDLAVGIARMVIVARGGDAKGRIVMNLAIGEHLAGEDAGAREWAMHILIHQLTLVALLELVERRLPGTLLSPIGDRFRASLYAEVDAAIQGYVAARMSAGFGDAAEFANLYRGLLITALKDFKAEVERARLAYRYDGDIPKLLDVALSSAGQVLYFASELLGVCAGSDEPMLDAEGGLADTLREASLVHWLPDFGRDLERFFFRLGAWDSFEEFLAFNRHVERLLWSVGIFPWQSPEGDRIEVPLFTDAEALMSVAALRSH